MQAEDPNELIKRVTAATLKAVAGQRDEEVNVNFAPGGASLTGNQAHLPALSGNTNAESFTKLRGAAYVRGEFVHHDDAIEAPTHPQHRVIW